MDTEPDSPEGDELDVLVDLVELYESKHVAMGYPSRIAAIEFRMEQAGLRPADLVSFIGSRAKVSEVLSGKRAITMPMARALHEHLGIPAAVLLQEPKTYLDGVALRLGDGRPVIGLTLRYDRIDNFWFCLLHELAHVGRHMENDRGQAFVDDFTLRKLDGRREDPREAQADEWAEEALIPRMDWEASAVRDRPTTMAVMNLANALQVHPAIVAGRVRYERKSYRLLSQFVGTGEVRRQFDTGS